LLHGETAVAEEVQGEGDEEEEEEEEEEDFTCVHKGEGE
jgi:hypothetical protein